VLIGLKLLLHLVASLGDGWFRDELYYVACADHLAVGYVDHPPLSIFLLKALRTGFGDSLLALRLCTAAIGALTVLFVGMLAREMGGRKFAQALAMLAAVLSPIMLGVNSFYSMNSVELLLWAAAAFLLARLLAQPSTSLWVAFGMVVGFGLLNKISKSWYVAGAGLGLLLSTKRSILLRRGSVLAAIVATLLFVPHVIWQIENGWPTLQFMRNASSAKMVAIPPLDFVLNQLLVVGPHSALIWVSGLIALMLWPPLRGYRPLGWMYLCVLGLLIANGTSRANYLAPAYAPLFAAGGVALEAWTSRVHWLRLPLVFATALLGLATLPLALPILPPDLTVEYGAATGITPHVEEKDRRGALSQHLADRFGWESLVATIADIYRALPEEERQQAAIVMGNYGQAGAIDVLGPIYGLPHAWSGHNNYWLWGPPPNNPAVLIVTGIPRALLEQRFASVEEVGRTRCRWCRPDENDRGIFLCRRPQRPLAELWTELKHYI
jgi:4-amino-4-deoxy-L-arabinose transferase-like glycosyltransferase